MSIRAFTPSGLRSLAAASVVALCTMLACGNSSDSPSGNAGSGSGGTPNPALGGGAGVTQGTSGSSAGGSQAASGGSAGESGEAGAAGEAGPPEPMFDASALSVVGMAGLPLCQLSDDGRYLLINVKNGGTTDIGATPFQVSTDGASYELRVASPPLTAGNSGTLKFDRGPLVGFVADWHFTVTIDPDHKHGAPHTPIQGECTDLRSRAQAGMVPLATWYDTDTGLWDVSDWWTSANQLETVIDYSRETGDTQYFSEIDDTFVKNQANNFDQFGYYDDDGWWAITWVKAYDLTHQQKYLDMAKTIFTRMSGAWDDKCGGGIYWAGTKAGANAFKNKNAIPNELFLELAARLHLRTSGDS
jgi:Glycosyl hydrolase family 76